MADLNLDLEYFNHRKTKRLVGLLKKGSDVLPIRMWTYYAMAYPDGDGRLTDHSIQEIESIAGWWGSPGVMVAAMKTVKFLDLSTDGTYSLHNWLKRQGHIRALKERARNAAEARWGKIKGDAQACPQALPHPPIHPTIPPPSGGGIQKPQNGSPQTFLETVAIAESCRRKPR